MEQGTRVEVRSRFDDRWSRGFEVAEVVDEGDSARYKLKRRSDGSVLRVVRRRRASRGEEALDVVDRVVATR
jgi:hypothetical protein